MQGRACRSLQCPVIPGTDSLELLPSDPLCYPNGGMPLTRPHSLLTSVATFLPELPSAEFLKGNVAFREPR